MRLKKSGVAKGPHAAFYTSDRIRAARELSRLVQDEQPPEPTLSQDEKNRRLFAAMNSGDKAKEIKSAVELGADINARRGGQDGATVFMMAASSGREDLVELLYELGADPTLRVHRVNAAGFASANGHYKLARRIDAMCASFRSERMPDIYKK